MTRLKTLKELTDKYFMSGAPKADPKQLQQAMTDARKKQESKLFELNGEALDLGANDSLRYNILTSVLGEKYDHCISELRNFLAQESVYPNFKEKVTRLINHSIDLIYAIKAKRNFPGLSSLTRPKQQELREKYLEHFRELQITLKRVEKVETDLRIGDVRSTIYVVQAICVAGLAIGILAFILEGIHGLALTSFVVVDDIYTKAINFVFDLTGL